MATVSLRLCNFCDFQCRSDGVLMKHIRDVHENEPNFKVFCTICGKDFNRWSSLKKHLHRIHHESVMPEANGSCETNHQQSTDGLEAGGEEGDTSDDVDPKWDSALFLLRATEEHSLTHGGVEGMCDSAQWLVDSVCSKIAKNIQGELDAMDTPPDATVKQNILSACQPGEIFCGLRSRYSREAYYKDHFKYVPPSPVLLGSEWEWSSVQGIEKLVEVKHYGYTIDLFSSLHALMSNPAVYKEVSVPHLSTDGKMRDICDGQFVKTHPFFRQYPNALLFLMYYDDIEVANPLGAKAGTHKLGAFYYMLGNIRSVYRSSIRAIQLFAVAKTQDIKKYGCEALIMPFLEQMKTLEDKGHHIQLCDEDRLVHGAAVCMCGDTPASNFVGGFKEGVGFSLRKCRMCLATADDLHTKFHESECILRDKQTHNYYLTLLDTEEATHYSVTYGVNRKSPLVMLESFDITKCLPYDVMHTIFEGVVPHHLKALLRYLIDTCQYFHLDEINRLIKTHAYGYSESDTKPSPIKRTTTSTDFHFSESASQMMTLMRLLPFMVGHLVENDDDHWVCFLILWDICSMVCAFEVTPDDATHLSWLVQTYLESFSSLYADTTITPKMHFLVHLPKQILLFGPLRLHWCMRFESKNAQLKSYVSRCFKNVPKSVAIHHQQWMCYQLATRNGQMHSNYLYAGDEVRSGTMTHIVEHGRAVAALCGENLPDGDVVALRARGVKILGTTYLNGAVVRVNTPSELGDAASLRPFVYGQIQEVYVYHDNKVFLLTLIQEVSYEEHLKAVCVRITDQALLCHFSDLYCHGVLHLKRKNCDLYLVERDNWGMSCPF